MLIAVVLLYSTGMLLISVALECYCLGTNSIGKVPDAVETLSAPLPFFVHIFLYTHHCVPTVENMQYVVLCMVHM